MDMATLGLCEAAIRCKAKRIPIYIAIGSLCKTAGSSVTPKDAKQRRKVIDVQHKLAGDSHSVEKVTVSYLCWGSQSREMHELAMQTAFAGTLLLRHCLASAFACMLVLLNLVMATLLPVGISILPIHIGMLPTVMGLLPIAIGVLPIAVGVLPIAIGVLPIAIGVLPRAIGVLPIAVVRLATGLLLIAILLLARHGLLVQITRKSLVPIRLTWMLAKTICMRQV